MAAAAPPATRPAPAMGGLVGTVPLPSVPVGFMPPPMPLEEWPPPMPMEEWSPPMPMLPVVTTVKGGASQSEVGMGSRVTMSSVVGAGLQSGQTTVVTSAARATAGRVSTWCHNAVRRQWFSIEGKDLLAREAARAKNFIVMVLCGIGYRARAKDERWTRWAGTKWKT